MLSFDFQTQNIVTKEESLKNQEEIAKNENSVKVVKIQKIKGKLTSSGEDIYFKINAGPNMFKTLFIEDAKKDFILTLNQDFYTENTENKIIFAAYDKDLLKDDVLGFCNLPLKGLSTGTKTLKLTPQ